VFSTLVSMARQRDEFDGPRCLALLDLFAVSSDARRLVQRRLRSLGLTELQFSMLITLLAVAPSPSTPTGLADSAGASCASVTAALDDLQERGLVVREHGVQDRRTRLVSLQTSGSRTAEKAATVILHLLCDIARPLEHQAPRVLHTLCDQLASHATQICPG